MSKERTLKGAVCSDRDYVRDFIGSLVMSSCEVLVRDAVLFSIHDSVWVSVTHSVQVSVQNDVEGEQ